MAGPAFRADAGQVKSIVETLDSNVEYPVVVTLDDERQHTVESKHVKRVQHTVKETGEWFIPHVVEPAFGIDRILWHILDHAFIETEKSGEPYRILQLSNSISPIDVAIVIVRKGWNGCYCSRIASTLLCNIRFGFIV